MFIDDYFGILRVLIVGTCAYIGLVFLLRVSGKRTLSKMNAFDFVVTIAIGSTLATVILSKQTPLAEGLVGLALLILLQFCVTWLSIRSTSFKRFIKAEPTMLYYNGDFVRAMMKRERVTEDEIFASLRQDNIADISSVSAVILETDGTFSVIKSNTSSEKGKTDTLHNVRT